ncbi:MAG: translation initiation factor IF-2, partial [Lachnospiraceae bacterium]|nr:translation initiation factor IF-2 [Lachnospiraceae bacterium]
GGRRGDFQQNAPGRGGDNAGGNKRKGPQDKDKRRKDQPFNEENDRRGKNRPGRFIKPEKKPEEKVEEQIKVISVPEKLTIRELAEKMRMQPAEIIKKLFLQGQVMTVNSELTYEEAEAIALEYEILCEKEEKVDVIEELLREEEDAPEDMTERAPVICVMGHVDHGKTSLLDKIRSTSVTDKEAGGITQHIGAYTVSVGGRSITFLDTPGHEAFTAMRMRGASSTDIAVLVVAADDGVMPQTVEAINHAKAAGVEIIVAVNKIDKPDANVNRVKQEMTEYDLVSTDFGGTTEFVPVSAKTGEGIEDLLETILLTADILELKANAKRNARGLVLEAKLDKGRGPVANVLIQKGTLHVGDYISAGEGFGRVRAMVDDKGRRVKEAKPSQPVEVLGLSDVPGAGETIVAHDDEKTARSYAMTYKTQHKADLIEETRMRMSLDDLFNQMKEGNLKEFNLILKADVQGSAEALKQSLLKLSNEEVVVKVIHAGVGAINESDVTLASASNAVIIGFNVTPDALAKAMADREKVDIRLYKVIYQAIDDVEAALKGMLAPVYEEKIIGHAEVRQIFKASAVGNIAGSYVTDGIFRRDCKIRIRRGEEQIYEGALASLKRFKDDVKEVREGYECGLVFEGFDQMQVGDIAEAYELVEVPRT